MTGCEEGELLSESNVEAAHGIRLLALRCTGFNNVNLEAAAACGVRIVRVT